MYDVKYSTKKFVKSVLRTVCREKRGFEWFLFDKGH